MAEIWDLSVVELSERVRCRELSPLDVTRCLLGRIEEFEPALRAWEAVDADGALATARQLERWMAAGDSLGPLAGVPLGIKDYYDVAGLPTTAGSPLLAGKLAEQ